MADVKACVDFVLRQEDATLSGVITDYPDDPGGTTRFGLCSKWHPELRREAFFDYSVVSGRRIPAISAPRALSMAEKTYDAIYSPSLRLDRIDPQAPATALLSFGVLEGIVEASRNVQNALVDLGARLDEDGEVGPITVAAINRADPAALLRKIIDLQEAHFAAIVRKTPSQRKWLHGWDNRAEALLKLL